MDDIQAGCHETHVEVPVHAHGAVAHTDSLETCSPWYRKSYHLSHHKCEVILRCMFVTRVHVLVQTWQETH